MSSFGEVDRVSMEDSNNESGGHDDDNMNAADSGQDASLLPMEDWYLPITNVTRFMKKALPDDAKISKEAEEAVVHCASEFISFVTSVASYKCLEDKRMTITGDDLIWSMSEAGFDPYTDPLQVYLKKFRRETESGLDGTSSSQPQQQDGVLGAAPENGTTMAVDEQMHGSPGAPSYHHKMSMD